MWIVLKLQILEIILHYTLTGKHFFLLYLWPQLIVKTHMGLWIVPSSQISQMS